MTGKVQNGGASLCDSSTRYNLQSKCLEKVQHEKKIYRHAGNEGGDAGGDIYLKAHTRPNLLGKRLNPYSNIQVFAVKGC